MNTYRRISYFFLLLFLAGVLSTCKKYPEGGKHYGVKSRINGTWEFKQFFINGIDSTSTRSSCLLLYPKITFSGGVFEKYNQFRNTSGNSTACGSGYFRIIDHKNQLGMGDGTDLKIASDPAGVFYFGQSTAWDILKLTDEMKLKTNYNGKEYILIMQKVK